MTDTPKLSPSPPVRVRRFLRCRWCGTKIPLHRDYCSLPHKRAYENWLLKWGAKLMRVALKWRRQRKPGQFGDVTFVIDQALYEDRERRKNWGKAPPDTAEPLPPDLPLFSQRKDAA
jgi:hypothetical protein